MKKQIVTFVIDKNLDIKNHLIGLDSYKRKLHSKTISKNEYYETLLKLPFKKRKEIIRKNIERFYSPEKNKFTRTLAKDINKEWGKIEARYFYKLEKIHGHPFPYHAVKATLSSANRFGYDVEGKWFAVSMMQNKFISIDIAMHELMHFMFHKYYWKMCERKGLSWKQIWDIKESFTVLLNTGFANLRFQSDNGYPEHKQIRLAITKSWNKYHNFEKALSSAIQCTH